MDELIGNLEGCYIDATYGRGGHAEEIIKRLQGKGRLMVIDRDKEAIDHAISRYRDHKEVEVVNGTFSHMGEYLQEKGWPAVDGVIMDLGVSSPQLDNAERGFSFMQGGPLDMRMDTSRGMTAAEWLASAREEEISLVLKEYGEERFHRRISRAIVSQREIKPLVRTEDLVELIKQTIPFQDRHKHPATRTFQAVRIRINNELEEIEKGLEAASDALAAGGRLVVISFHSLEDRIVKRFMKRLARGDDYPSRLPVTEEMLNRKLKIIRTKEKPDRDEVARNPRARSAVMRVAERLAA